MIDFMEDNALTPEERQCLEKFQGAVKETVSRIPMDVDPTPNLKMFELANMINLDVTGLHKDGVLLCALWYVILLAVKERTPLETMKYPVMENFTEIYGERFADEPDCERRALWHTANWMYIMFSMIPAKKNKGLAMQVVPKVVEGWDAKYVTGSGQTKATANRVSIFEHEGEVKPNERGKTKLKKKAMAMGQAPKSPIGHKKRRKGEMAGLSEMYGLTGMQGMQGMQDISGLVGGGGMDGLAGMSAMAGMGMGGMTGMGMSGMGMSGMSGISAMSAMGMSGMGMSEMPHSSSMSLPSAFTFAEPYGTLGQFRDKQSRSSSGVRSQGTTDSEEGSALLSADAQKTFAIWQEATENFGLGLLNLSRSNSAVNGLANVEQQLTEPVDYQRGFSWTEIPLNTTSAPPPPTLTSLTSIELTLASIQQAEMMNAQQFQAEPRRAQFLDRPGSVVTTEELSDMFSGYK
ncbi:hypothetical protein B484DRAFT_444655 [Ochromonadaceae sp. CCMP2298]|nr:hypothetical protein B484DRAFT_444655 [Ochromonadaceae sp. CCMP2298]|mmetsp:Transcript_26053/g.57690  ORF Transcript_26053/g.57690 Transcript_26053/m.57690 type:complete len:462 (-) Transcript_26053:304-1689(-)